MPELPEAPTVVAGHPWHKNKVWNTRLKRGLKRFKKKWQEKWWEI